MKRFWTIVGSTTGGFAFVGLVIALLLYWRKVVQYLRPTPTPVIFQLVPVEEVYPGLGG